MRSITGILLIGMGAALACSSGTNDATEPDASSVPNKDGGPSNNPGTDGATDDVDANVTGDGGDAGPLDGPPPSILPVSYQRPDVGTPLTAMELQTATDELIAILKDTRYFDFVDERVHGWPKSDPNNGYWWGTYWTGISVSKTAGTVTYKHSNDGSDNAGIHTSPYLEGACWAHLLWGQTQTADLIRRIARGMSAWVIAMERTAGDTSPRLLSRAFYPPSVQSNEGGRSLFIDTSLSRPGIDAEPSDYIHHPSNPTLGDIYVKNKRSKDDIGHMLRAIAQVQACAPRLDADGQADMAKLVSLYEAWSTDVDGRNFVIPTRDKGGNVYEPNLQLARYVSAVECVGTMAVRLGHTNAPGNIDCQTGMSSIEATAWPFIKNDARQIVRTHHAAAVVWAHKRLVTTTGLPLLQGLGDRVAKDFEYGSSGSPPSGFNPMDAASFIGFAANVGVPLRSNEIRWLHTKLHEAYLGMRAPEHKATFNLFDATVPDGAYSFDPPNIGLFHRDLGVLLGSCASPYRNPTGRPLLDCDRLVKAFAK